MLAALALATAGLVSCGGDDSGSSGVVERPEGAEEPSAEENAAVKVVREFLIFVDDKKQDQIDAFLSEARLNQGGKPWGIPLPYEPEWTRKNPNRIGVPELDEDPTHRKVRILDAEELKFHQQITGWAPPEASIAVLARPRYVSGSSLEGVELLSPSLLFFMRIRDETARITGYVNYTEQERQGTALVVEFFKAVSDERFEHARRLLLNALRYNEDKAWGADKPFIPDLVLEKMSELGAVLSTNRVITKFMDSSDMRYMMDKTKWAPPHSVMGATVSQVAFGDQPSNLVLHFFFAPRLSEYHIAGFICNED